MACRRWSIHECVSRLLAGGTGACVLLFFADVILITPFWELPLVKSDERWERVFFVAKFGLPATFIVGALVGLAWRRSHEFRLGWGQLAGYCLVVAFISKALRPEVAKIRSGGVGPLYEVVPDTIAWLFVAAAVAIAVWRPRDKSSEAEPARSPP